MRLAAGLVVLALAAIGRAQTFERQAGEIGQKVSLAARRARSEMSRRQKQDLPPLPPRIVIGGPKDKHRKEELKLFAGGWKTAMQALNEGKKCRQYFADHGDDYDKVIRTLEATEYNFQRLGYAIGAETLDDHTVFINSDGIFVDATNGEVTLNGKRYDLEEPQRVRAMVILHELGHQLGIFGADAGPDLAEVNAAHSLDIIRNCLPGNNDDKPQPY